MTIAHVEKFAELVAKDPALLAKLGLDKVNANAAAAEASAHAFVQNSIREAKALGLVFTEKEANQYLAQESQVLANGELSNSQLEAVAGGKGGGDIPVIGPAIGAIDKNVIQPVGTFFNGGYNKQIEQPFKDAFSFFKNGGW